MDPPDLLCFPSFHGFWTLHFLNFPRGPTHKMRKWGSRSILTMFYNENELLFCTSPLKVIRFYCETQRFRNAIITFHFPHFPLGITNNSASPESRSGITMFSQVNGVEFWDLLQKVLHLHCETPRFRNANPAFNYLHFSLGITNNSTSPEWRSGNVTFPR